MGNHLRFVEFRIFYIMLVTVKKCVLTALLVLFFQTASLAENPELQYEIIDDAAEAAMLIRVGDMDNLGFGWSEDYDVFSGQPAPVHPFPWDTDPEDADGTDRIMVVSSYSQDSEVPTDGYTSSTVKGENDPRPVSIRFPRPEYEITGAVLQVFTDDFQAPLWGTSFQAFMNGIRIIEFENILNSLDQTGPVGNLISFELPPEIVATLDRGELEVFVDDPITGAGDGFAFDFFRLLINPKVPEPPDNGLQPFFAIKGKILNSFTQAPVDDALIKINGPDFEDMVSSTSSGFFVIEQLPRGNYDFEISKSGFTTKKITSVFVEPDFSDIRNILLEPRTPVIKPEMPLIEDSTEDGRYRVVFNVVVTDPDGFDDIKEVKLSHPSLTGMLSLGVKMERIPDPELDNKSARYQYSVLLPSNIAPRHYSLMVKAMDGTNSAGYASIDFDAVQRIRRSLRHQEFFARTVNNTVNRQTLSIRVKAGADLFFDREMENDIADRLPGKKIFSINRHGRSSVLIPATTKNESHVIIKFYKDFLINSGKNFSPSTTEETCYVEVNIYRPDMTLYGTYKVEDSENITIPDAESGEWTYETINYCAESIDVEIETRGANTGILTGKIQASDSGTGLGDAFLSWNMGGETVSQDSGYFSTVVIAGEGLLASSATDYKTNLRTDISIQSGETKTVIVKLIPEDVLPAKVPDKPLVQEIIEPLAFSDPDVQPFAAGIVGEELVISALFPAYESPVWIYLGIVSDAPSLASYFFLFNTEDELTILGTNLTPWRENTMDWQIFEPLVRLPVSLLPHGGYTFYSMVTSDPAALKTYDLKHFTLTLSP